jgi:hypothetical protein
MTERWLRRDDDFLKFQPYRAIVGSPLIRNRPARRGGVFLKLTVFIVVGLLLTGTIYFIQFWAVREEASQKSAHFANTLKERWSDRSAEDNCWRSSLTSSEPPQSNLHRFAFMAGQLFSKSFSNLIETFNVPFCLFEMLFKPVWKRISRNFDHFR